jgi:hypothetical protein
MVLSLAPFSPLCVGIPGCESSENVCVASHSSSRDAADEDVHPAGDHELE